MLTLSCILFFAVSQASTMSEEESQEYFSKLTNEELRKILDDFAAESKKKIIALEKKANQGDKVSQFKLGVMFYEDVTVQDYAKAAKWFIKAAEQGVSEAQNNIGNMYQHGIGVEKNEALALQWYDKAAKQGLDVASKSASILRSQISFNETLLAAKKGNSNAQFALAIEHLSRGEPEKMIFWLKKSSGQKNVFAQIFLAGMFEEGVFLPQDYSSALDLYTKASEQGHRYAQFKLGEMYQKGKGIKVDLIKAYMWFNIAAVISSKNDYGKEEQEIDKDSAMQRKLILERLNPGQVEEAQSLTREWLERHDK
tara:strand:+ start:9055 stop:9987 length:933 start_codon:yes stop_codon:yes gene_type:complete